MQNNKHISEDEVNGGDGTLKRKGESGVVSKDKSVVDDKPPPKGEGRETCSGKKRRQRSMKKDPRAPKRFRSSYILFSQDRFPEIRENLKNEGLQLETVDITKMVSEEWKILKPSEKLRYEEMSKLDKERYEVEKKMYSGSWQVPTSQKLTKDVTAPRRPASAFLMFSNPRRAALKKERPDLCNGDISKLLSKMWKDATPAERKPFEEEEIKLRDQYKDDVAIWREEQEALLQTRHNKAMRLAERGVTAASEISSESTEEEGAAGGGTGRDSPEVVYSGTIPGRGGGRGGPFMVGNPPPPTGVFVPSGSVPQGHPLVFGWGGAPAAGVATHRMRYPPSEEVVFQRIHGTGPKYLVHRPPIPPPSIPPPYFTYEESYAFANPHQDATATPTDARRAPHSRAVATPSTARRLASDPSLFGAASGLDGSGMGTMRTRVPPTMIAAPSSAPITFVNENGVPMMLQAVPIPMATATGPPFFLEGLLPPPPPEGDVPPPRFVGAPTRRRGVAAAHHQSNSTPVPDGVRNANIAKGTDGETFGRK